MKTIFCLVFILLSIIKIEAQNITVPLQNIDIEGKWISSTGKQFQVTKTDIGIEYKNVESGDMFYCNSKGTNTFKMVKRTDGMSGMNTLKVIDNSFIFNINQAGETFLWRRFNNQNDIVATGNWESSTGNVFKITASANGIEYENIKDKTKFTFNKVRPNEYLDKDGNYLFIVERNRIVRFNNDLSRKTEWEKNLDASEEIQKYVENCVNTWQKKGKFEKTIDYQKRVNKETLKYKTSEFTQQAIDSSALARFNWKNKTNNYDADNENFKITLNDFGDILVHVPLAEAPTFDSNFQALKFNKPKFVYNQQFLLSYVEIINPANNKKYIADLRNNLAYNSQTFIFNINDIDIDVSAQLSVNAQKNTLVNAVPDVDIEIPKTQKYQPNIYVLAIGNEDYTKYQPDLKSESNVDFARNDATVFATYCEKVLGIPNENITLLKDAISSQMRREINRLLTKAQYAGENTELIFYYSGHGFPYDENKDGQSDESYIMPVDISGSNVVEGIKLSQLYKDLTQFPSKKITVILDACFSGGGRNAGLLSAKAVKIKVDTKSVQKGNLVVFSASSGEQESLFYKEKSHGMFTYFFLKKLKETKGEVTYDDMAKYVKQIVPLTSSDKNYKTQNPEVKVSPDVQNTWAYFKF